VSESVTVVSDAHRDMMKQLARRGVEFREALPSPPYQVDIYVPAFHICIEVDGPQHGKRADDKRDERLLEVYLLPTFRVKANDVNRPSKWAPDLAAFLQKHAKTAAERWEPCSMKVPW